MRLTICVSGDPRWALDPVLGSHWLTLCSCGSVPLQVRRWQGCTAWREKTWRHWRPWCWAWARPPSLSSSPSPVSWPRSEAAPTNPADQSQRSPGTGPPTPTPLRPPSVGGGGQQGGSTGIDRPMADLKEAWGLLMEVESRHEIRHKARLPEWLKVGWSLP